MVTTCPYILNDIEIKSTNFTFEINDMIRITSNCSFDILVVPELAQKVTFNMTSGVFTNNGILFYYFLIFGTSEGLHQNYNCL